MSRDELLVLRKTLYELLEKGFICASNSLAASPVLFDAELQGVREFEVVTDYKNLEYFTHKQKLSERHVRWNLELARFPNMRLRYRPGKENVRADALSRRDQDMQKDDLDEHLASREFIMLVPAQAQDSIMVMPVRGPTSDQGGDLSEGNSELIQDHWDEATQADSVYQEVKAAVRENKRSLLSSRKIAISLGDCTIDEEDKLRWRDRIWVLDYEPLRTGVI
ncbi:hypothetical protein P3342_007349 [Pyrenophora teres f. teres]|nr:hypothetical protein P3342_007349 [Pyrenophora teres f. teres]